MADPGDGRSADPLDDVTPSDLQRQNEEYIKWAVEWQNLRLLYRGGYEFLLAAGGGTSTRASASATSAGEAFLDAMDSDGSRRRRRFLWQFEGEPDVKYVSMWERAFYVNYLGAVLNYFRHWLFSKEPAIRPTPQIVNNPVTGKDETVIPDAPLWWPRFSANATGGGKSFHDFMKDVFLEALLLRRAGWMVGSPPLDPAFAASLEGQYVTQAQAEELGLTDSLLTPFTAEEIVDWQRDAAGELQWVIVRKQQQVREFPRQRQAVDVWTYMDRQRWRSWRVAGDKASQQLQVLGDGSHDLGHVPFIMFELPHDLWVTNQIAAQCVDIFNRQNRLSNVLQLSCFPQAVLTTPDPSARNRIMGDGVLLELMSRPPDQGGNETLTYVTPPIGPWEFIQRATDAAVQELYRAVHQLSLAVDTKAVSSVARSGVSKQEDRKSIEVILTAFGGYMRETIIATLNLVSKVQGDNTEWSVDGFDDFDVTDLMDELSQFASVQTAQVNSPTWNREMEKRFATGRILGHASPATRDAIEREIDAHYDQQKEAAGLDGEGGDPFGGRSRAASPTRPQPSNRPPAILR